MKQLKLKVVKNLLIIEPKFEAKSTWIQSVLLIVLSYMHTDYTLADYALSLKAFNHAAYIIGVRTW